MNFTFFAASPRNTIYHAKVKEDRSLPSPGGVMPLFVGVVPGVLVLFAALLVNYWLRPGLALFLVLANAFILCQYLFLAWRASWLVPAWDRRLIVAVAAGSAAIVALRALDLLFAGYGWVGFLIIGLVYSGYMVWRGWGAIRWGIASIERQLFGETSAERVARRNR